MNMLTSPAKLKNIGPEKLTNPSVQCDHMLPQVPGMCELTLVVKNTSLQIKAQFRKNRNSENNLFAEAEDDEEAQGYR